MSECAQVAFGLCGLLEGSAGLIGALIVWRTGKREIESARRRLDLLKPQ